MNTTSRYLTLSVWRRECTVSTELTLGLESTWWRCKFSSITWRKPFQDDVTRWNSCIQLGIHWFGKQSIWASAKRFISPWKRDLTQGSIVQGPGTLAVRPRSSKKNFIHEQQPGSGSPSNFCLETFGVCQNSALMCIFTFHNTPGLVRTFDLDPRFPRSARHDKNNIFLAQSAFTDSHPERYTLLYCYYTTLYTDCTLPDTRGRIPVSSNNER